MVKQVDLKLSVLTQREFFFPKTQGSELSTCERVLGCSPLKLKKLCAYVPVFLGIGS